LAAPERYEGALSALKQGRRFGLDFTKAESIAWVSKLY
jgi:hypothetical protein